jgi:O-antigen ligase
LITARDIAVLSAPPPFAPPLWTGPQCTAAARLPLRERMLRTVLFLAVLASSVAFIEPSPHDALVGLLGLCCLAAGVRFERLIALPFLLLVVMNVAGLSAYFNAVGQEGTLQYVATSLYLAVAGMLFASLFSAPDPRRLELMRTAYVITAVAAALLGTAAYFRIPGMGIFLVEERAAGPFKDPNVFAPFLVWPALALAERLLRERFRLVDLAALAAILVGLLLSFSRGAWFHFAVSAALVIFLCYVTAPNQTMRLRISLLTGISLAVLAAALVTILSIPSVSSMLAERAHLFNSYDVGAGGRFTLQQLAVSAVLDYPNGMGPLEFGRINGLQQHNVYLQAFLVYGWAGAMAYLLLVGTTLAVGLRASFLRTPFQPYMITATGAFFGEMAEGFIIDTDHWRHFWLMMGLMWGMFVAAQRHMATTRSPSAPTGLLAR